MPNPIPKDQIKGIECRHAVLCPPPQGETDDIHLVKEIIHTSDGRRVPNVRLLRNFKRPFWITKKGARNHKDKKEWELIENVDKFESTQTDLVDRIIRALPFGAKGNLRRVCRSPYVYGADILSTAVVKRSYQDNFPGLITPYSVATFDVESDMVKGTNEIIMATLSYKERVVTAIQKSYLEGYCDVKTTLFELLSKYLGKYVEKRGIKWEIEIVDTEIDIIRTCFSKAHEWQPDIVAIWNIDYDMPKILEACDRAKVDPKDIFSDPSIPYKYRHFNYTPGQKQKVTASGEKTPIPMQARWHVVTCPSSFYFLDAMCVYKQVRTGNPEEPSYSLNAILDKHLKIRKLDFVEAEGLQGPDYHQFMQEKFPLEYVIYNVFDCVSMEELDEEIKDLQITLPLFAGCSDFANFKSQPRRVANEFHYFALKYGKVFGTTSDQMTSPLDEKTLGLDDWIVTLPAHLVMDNGLRCIAENPNHSTNIRAHVGDLDVAGSYPNGECVFNISKETTHRELCRIRGVAESIQRTQGINLSGGHVNAVEFACEMYGLPGFDTLLKSFLEQAA